MMQSKISQFIPSIIPLLFSLLGGSILLASFYLGWGDLNDPAPGMYPGILGILMLVFSIICYFSSFVNNSISIQQSGLIRASFVLGALFFWGLAMPYCGYILVTFISIAVITQTICSAKNWRFTLGYSIFLTLMVYLLFEKWFFLDLPQGILG